MASQKIFAMASQNVLAMAHAHCAGNLRNAGIDNLRLVYPVNVRNKCSKRGGCHVHTSLYLNIFCENKSIPYTVLFTTLILK